MELLRQLHGLRDVPLEDLIPLLSNGDSTVRGFAEEELAERLDRKTIDGLVRSLDKRTTRDRRRLLNIIVTLAPELAIPRVIALVLEGGRGLSVVAMESLARQPAKRVGVAFVEFLRSDRADVRHLALVKIKASPELMAQEGTRRVIADLADDDDERIRVEVLDVLVEIDPEEAVRLSLELLKDPSPMVQQRAVGSLRSALERIQASEKTEDKLLSLMTDGSEVVRNAVVDIIVRRPDTERILRKLLLFCRDVMGWLRDRTLQSLRRHGRKLSAAVVSLMEDPDPEVRSMALVLGATLKDPAAVPHIIRLLDDDDWWLRMIAADSLGSIRDPRAVRALIGASEDPDCAIACIEALGRIGHPSALNALVAHLSRPEVEIRAEAIEAIEAIGDPSAVAVLEACADQDPASAIRARAELAARTLAGGAPAEPGGRPVSVGLETTTVPMLSPIEALLMDVRELGGSDLHIMVDAPPTVRVHGELHDLEGPRYTAAATRELLGGVLGPRENDLLHRFKQADFCLEIPAVGRYRCNVYVERKGLAGSFRVIPREVPTLEDIGLPTHLADLVNHHQGMVVVAGPSGSGKSTTLAALVNLFNEHRRCHVLLLEDPIEFIHPSRGCLINQREVGRHTRSFSAALRSALREDPDIIVVGEMRDLETVRLAIEASETGHLVIGTMNTTSAPNTIDRIVESFPVGEQTQVRVMLSETLKAVIAQSLVPRADEDGRVAVFEVMLGTLDVRTLIRDNKSFQILSQMQIGETKGHVTVDRALQRLLSAGRITPETAWSRARAKAEFEASVSGDFLAQARTGDFSSADLIAQSEGS
jgi:twitching motility protein PilT